MATCTRCKVIFGYTAALSCYYLTGSGEPLCADCSYREIVRKRREEEAEDAKRRLERDRRRNKAMAYATFGKPQP